MKRTIISVVVISFLVFLPAQINTVPSSNSTFLTDLQDFLREEEPDRYVLQHNDFVSSGCTHGVGALTQTIASCVAFVEGKYVSTSGSITYTPATNPDTCWVALDDSLTGTPGGIGNFVRAAGTRFFLDCVSAATPTAPTGTLLILTTTTSLVAVSAVSGSAATDAHNNVAAAQGVGMIHAAQFGAVCDNVADDTAALQATLDYADGDDGAISYIDRKCNWTPGSITWDTGDDVVFDKSTSSGMRMWAATPLFSLQHSVVAGNSAGTYGFNGIDSAGNYDRFGDIGVIAEDETSGSEDGRMTIGLRRAGTLTDTAIIGETGSVGLGSGIVQADMDAGGIFGSGTGTLGVRNDGASVRQQVNVYNGNVGAGAASDVLWSLSDTGNTWHPSAGVRAGKVNNWTNAADSDGVLSLNVYDGTVVETAVQANAFTSAVSMPANYVLTLGTVSQATLAAMASANGSLIYCSDCTVNSATCAGGGTGAVAKRINAGWRCD